MALVDNAEEQVLLEEVLEQSKPPLPAQVQSLHYLIAAPFRYARSWPSRFRTATDPGVWYGAHGLETSCAEVAYWRWRFVHDSDAFGDTPVLTEHTFYPAQVRGRAVDLTAPPWDAWQEDWTHQSDYSACQKLAQEARAAGIDWVQYRSVRDPGKGLCGAVLNAQALDVRNLTSQLGWISAVRGAQVTLTPKVLASRYQSLEFHFGRQGV